MLACPHHISWIVAVPGGLHRCNLCRETVKKSETTPKVNDLPDLEKKWDTHEKGGA
jgi:hypothetical protein